jgi:hypothetical protein
MNLFRLPNWRWLAKALSVVIVVSVALFIAIEIKIRTSSVKWIYESNFDDQYKIFKFKANTVGRYSFRGSDHPSSFRMNNEGWNSIRDYRSSRVPGVPRIACIGHSGTLSLRVNIADAYPQVLEEELLAAGIEAEVYSFAINLMDLAQALHVSRYAIDKFHPDILLIQATIHGNFMVSRQGYSLRVRIEEGGEVAEVMPGNPFKEPDLFDDGGLLTRLVYQSHLLRYLNKKYDARARVMNLKRKVASAFQHTEYVPYADRIDQHEQAYEESTVFRKNYQIAQHYLLNRFKELEQQHGVVVLFPLGPWHAASFNHPGGDPSATEEAQRSTTKELLARFDLRYLDLTEAFAKDYAFNGLKFDFLYDDHLNTHGHRLQGAALATHLLQRGLLAP